MSAANGGLAKSPSFVIEDDVVLGSGLREGSRRLVRHFSFH